MPICVMMLNIGRYSEITIVPTIAATTNITAGSIAFVKAETPAIVLEPISDTPQDTTSFNNSITWEFRIRISVIVRGAVPDNVADPTIESLHTKILTDPTVGGLTIDIRPSTTSFEILEADEPAGVVSCEFDIEYRTLYNSLTT